MTIGPEGIDWVNFVMADANGRISGYTRTQREAYEVTPARPGMAKYLIGDLMLGDSYKLYWVNDGALMARPEFTKTFDKTQVQADGVDETVMSDLAKGSRVRVTSPSSGLTTDTETDSVGLTLTFEEPGIWKVEVEEFPSLPKTFEIEAIE